jgi:transcriptional regulator with XRE-family HTH domain
MPKKSGDPVDAEVGLNIRFYRKQAGMSQEALGEKLGLTFQQIQKYEKGTNRVGAGRLTRIAKILDVPVSAFFGSSLEENEEYSGLSPARLLMIPGAVKLVEAYGMLRNQQLRNVFVRLIEELARDTDQPDIRPPVRKTRKSTSTRADR